MAATKLTVVQMLPALDMGGVERGTVELAAELVRQGHRSIVMSDGGIQLDQLKACGSEHLCWDVGRKSLKTLRWIRRVRNFLREQRPDILHLRSRLPAWIGYRAWKGLPVNERPHLVTTVHGFYTPGWYSSVMTRGEQVIAVSDSVRGYIRENYPEVSPDVIRVIHRGVDTTYSSYGYRPDDKWLSDWYRFYPQTRDKYLVCLPGRLTRWKGQEDFIKVIKGLKSAGLPVCGLIVGAAHKKKHAFEQELAGLIREAGLESDIIMTGHRQDVREIMSISSVVLSLSRDPEAFGRTTIEALSLGTPVAGYDHGGVAEQLSAICPDGLVPVADVFAMTELLLRWHERAPQVKQDHSFTLSNMLDATIKLYQSLPVQRHGVR